jgi:uncharacterized protein with HEPN domain
MTERSVAPPLADIIEAIERIRRVLHRVTLEAFEQNWEKRWLVERGIEIISEASRHLTDDIKKRRPEFPWLKVAGIGNVLGHAYNHIAPDALGPGMPERIDRLATMPTEEPERTAEAVRRALPELAKLDRYESRAVASARPGH